MKGALVHEAIVEGDEIKLHLRGVVGFCDVLFRMMVSVDAELSRCAGAEAVLEARFKKARLRSTLSGRPQRRRARINNICQSAGLPIPADAELVQQFLKSKRLIGF